MTPGRAYLSTEEIRSFNGRSDLWGAWLVLHCWGVIALALALFALWPNVLTFVLAVMLIGSRQLGLAILMHEAAHVALFKTRKYNEFAGEWLCGRPILADMFEYRRYHLKHHQHTQTEEDPDLNLSRAFPTTKASLRRKLLRDITGQTGFRQRSQQIMMAFKLAGEAEGMSRQDLAQAFSGPVLGRALIANGVIFSVMWAVGAWWWWFAFWALPLLTWFQLVLRVRNIAEHGVVEFSDDPLRNVRTTKAGPLMRLFLAPYWVNYHLEHHLIMHVPCRHLPRLHRLMLEKGYGDKMRIGRNYWDVLKLAASRPAG
ncbi:fatty acid desaturase family protein [Neptunicoccus cionae]|uniref:fatty acid desaturase family protein n=1 Tax=Neptunicoccus cionae TaxID=2035344 RepID=UPI000C792340|nr:fatty acid desaturase family protein [Amylibacter cionae]PLS23558.1 fatty acid desaturase [Amylibacter cionae]